VEQEWQRVKKSPTEFDTRMGSTVEDRRPLWLPMGAQGEGIRHRKPGATTSALPDSATSTPIKTGRPSFPVDLVKKDLGTPDPLNDSGYLGSLPGTPPTPATAPSAAADTSAPSSSLKARPKAPLLASVLPMVMWVVVMAALGTGLVLMMASQGREGDTRLCGKYRAMQFAAERRAAAEAKLARDSASADDLETKDEDPEELDDPEVELEELDYPDDPTFRGAAPQEDEAF